MCFEDNKKKKGAKELKTPDIYTNQQIGDSAGNDLQFLSLKEVCCDWGILHISMILRPSHQYLSHIKQIRSSGHTIRSQLLAEYAKGEYTARKDGVTAESERGCEVKEGEPPALHQRYSWNWVVQDDGAGKCRDYFVLSSGRVDRDDATDAFWRQRARFHKSRFLLIYESGTWLAT